MENQKKFKILFIVNIISFFAIISVFLYLFLEIEEMKKEQAIENNQMMEDLCKNINISLKILDTKIKEKNQETNYNILNILKENKNVQESLNLMIKLQKHFEQSLNHKVDKPKDKAEIIKEINDIKDAANDNRTFVDGEVAKVLNDDTKIEQDYSDLLDNIKAKQQDYHEVKSRANSDFTKDIEGIKDAQAIKELNAQKANMDKVLDDFDSELNKHITKIETTKKAKFPSNANPAKNSPAGPNLAETQQGAPATGA
ncbi:hypothetical protein [Candidatus Phytoplasma pini]|uniref:Uncharacterized protein n=1 Tax=Candidatus Phytoplasma pini TaxID=267362 RepID=A0A559KJ01_9MOLU|nr:hypothetical protein [Candidatus Phytoplasma pini]TVY12113.1 hypothetical protein MDPP_00350 [Candidatus Phytoplasma pini]